MNNFPWQQTRALITGANRGIGLALVEALIEKGVSRVYLAGRDPSAVQRAALLLADKQQMSVEGEVRFYKGATHLVPIRLDVTSNADIDRISQQIPQLDLLINNAGIANEAGFTSPESPAIAIQEMATHYLGPLNLTQALLPQLKASAKAVVVNISSIAGIANMPLLGPYSASKAALHSYTQGLRAELSRQGIFVQGVYPGPVDTRLSAGFEAAKPSPVEVARVILQALENGEEDVFPDAMSANSYQSFKADPKQLEKEYAAWLG